MICINLSYLSRRRKNNKGEKFRIIPEQKQYKISIICSIFVRITEEDKSVRLTNSMENNNNNASTMRVGCSLCFIYVKTGELAAKSTIASSIQIGHSVVANLMWRMKQNIHKIEKR